MKRIALCALGLGLLVGCQGYESALAALCAAPETCSECSQAAPENRMQILSRHAVDQVSNSKARELFDSLANMAPAERAATLDREAQEAGLSSCALADYFRAEAAGGGPD